MQVRLTDLFGASVPPIPNTEPFGIVTCELDAVKSWRNWGVLVIVGCVMTLNSRLLAATVEWIGFMSTSFQAPDNWAEPPENPLMTGEVPGPGNTVL